MALTRTRSPRAVTGTTTRPNQNLRANALGFPTVLAESIGVISPTMTAVLIIPFAFSFAGQGTWFVYAFGTVMLIFVVLNLNQFARRSTGAGSMYAYTARGLAQLPEFSRAGPSSGVTSSSVLPG